MDLNPKGFNARTHEFEFARHVVESQARLAVLPMAWLSTLGEDAIKKNPGNVDLDTLIYWVRRLEPVMDQEHAEETVVVTCNRVGVERGSVFAGSSVILAFKDGGVRVIAKAGAGTEELLVAEI